LSRKRYGAMTDQGWRTIEMSSLNKLPAKCQECAKSQAPRAHRKCHFCRDLEFHKYPFVREKFIKDAEIWDEAYFAETVG